LVIKQLNGQYECKSEALRSYYEECREILKSFPLVTLQHIPREHNEEANRLAQSASGYKENQEACWGSWSSEASPVPAHDCIQLRSREKTLRRMSTNETLMPLVPYEFCCAGKTFCGRVYLRCRRC
jgi:seryl-tRNA synthetase